MPSIGFYVRHAREGWLKTGIVLSSHPCDAFAMDAHHAVCFSHDCFVGVRELLPLCFPWG